MIYFALQSLKHNLKMLKSSVARFETIKNINRSAVSTCRMNSEQHCAVFTGWTDNKTRTGGSHYQTQLSIMRISELWRIKKNWQEVYLLGCYTVNTKHLYSICTMLEQRRRRCTNVIQMFSVCWVVAQICRVWNTIVGLFGIKLCRIKWHSIYWLKVGPVS